MFSRILLALASLALTAQAQQQIRSPDNNLWTCPDTQTIEVAYASYCTETSRSGSAIAGMSSIGNFPNAPSNYNSAANGFKLFCNYASGITCGYTAGAGNGLVIMSSQNTDCPAPPSTVPQPSPGVNYRKRDTQLEKRANYNTDTQFTCPRTSTNGHYLTDNQVSNGNRGGSTGYLYDCVWRGAGLSPDTRCTYDVTGARVTYQNQGVNRCPVNLCTAIKTGTENRRRRSVFDERAEMLRRHQVDTGVLRRRNSARKAIARAVTARDRQ